MENGPAYKYLELKRVHLCLQINVLALHLLMCSIGPPTQGYVYQKLVEAERFAELSGQSAVGNVQMIRH